AADRLPRSPRFAGKTEQPGAGTTQPSYGSESCVVREHTLIDVENAALRINRRAASRAAIAAIAAFSAKPPRAVSTISPGAAGDLVGSKDHVGNEDRPAPVIDCGTRSIASRFAVLPHQAGIP